jgi:cyclopropane fatty-acyl-phospholipid synthase-like methyltransferase
MLALANLTKADVLYDLGCGDGRIVVAAAKRYGCRAVGIDIDPLRVDESRANVDANGVAARVRIERQDLFDVELQEATVVTLYLSSSYNARLIPQLQRLKPNSRIVSHQFPIPGVKPAKTMRIRSKEDSREHVIYLWTAPLDAAAR